VTVMNDLIDIDLLLQARTTGLASFGEAESVLGGIAKAGALAGVAIAAAVTDAAIQASKMAAEAPGDYQLVMKGGRP